MRSVTFNENLKRPHKIYKRVGHPRSSWADDSLQRARVAYGLNDGQFNADNPEHVERMKWAAQTRVF